MRFENVIGQYLGTFFFFNITALLFGAASEIVHRFCDSQKQAPADPVAGWRGCSRMWRGVSIV